MRVQVPARTDIKIILRWHRKPLTLRLHVPANSPHTEYGLAQAYAVLYLIVIQINNLFWTASAASLIIALDKYAKSGVRGDPNLSYVDIDMDMDMAVDI